MHERLDVPLHTQVERRPVALDALDHAIGCPRDRPQVAPELVHGLMVKGVHVERFAADDARELRAGSIRTVCVVSRPDSVWRCATTRP